MTGKKIKKFAEIDKNHQTIEVRDGNIKHIVIPKERLDFNSTFIYINKENNKKCGF